MPFYLFSLESGGCGKSHLTQIIIYAASKVFLYRSGDPTKTRALLLAPKDVAAININGNTLDLAFHILCQKKLLTLNDANIAELKNKYSEVELVIIDEISVVSSKLFD